MDWARSPRRPSAGHGDFAGAAILPAVPSRDRPCPDLLVGAVPAGRAHPAHPAVPRAACHDSILAVLSVCHRSTVVGRRNYAIVLSLTGLALRGGEVACLGGHPRQGQADGRAAITVRCRRDMGRLPGERSAGDPLCGAVRNGEGAIHFAGGLLGHAGAGQGIRTRRCCPVRPSPDLSRRGMQPAGIRSVEAGVAQLLRRAQQRTTAINAKVDLARLAELVIPAPEGVAQWR